MTNSNKQVILHNETAKVTYWADFLPESIANDLLDKLYKEIAWQQYPITMFGKTYLQPRLIAWYGEKDISYQYSNTKLIANGWHSLLTTIRERLTMYSSVHYNSVLLNLYRDGQDSMGWHSDDEKELGQNPVIASVSLGAERSFQFRKKEDHKTKEKLQLENGSLLLMEGATQHYWQHQIAKTKKCQSPRINLTFRYIQS